MCDFLVVGFGLVWVWVFFVVWFVFGWWFGCLGLDLGEVGVWLLMSGLVGCGSSVYGFGCVFNCVGDLIVVLNWGVWCMWVVFYFCLWCLVVVWLLVVC